MRTPTRASRASVGGLVLLALLSCGDPAHEEPPAAARAAASSAPEVAPAPSPPEAGRWRRFRTHRFDPGLTPAQREEILRLEALGYADGVSDAPAVTGVLRHDPARAHAGLNLYTAGHRAEALLIDMDGHVLHRWRRSFAEIWPEHPDAGNDKRTFWRRVHLLPDGGILAIFEGLGLVRLDRDSRVVWSSTLRAHHDLAVTPDGRIHVLSREAHLLPQIDPQQPVLEDAISVLSLEDGRELARYSLLEGLAQSPYHDWLDRAAAEGPLRGDPLHTNTLVLLDGSFADRHPAFAAGRYLVSFLTLDTLAVYDPQSRRVVWALRGSFRKQHDPRPLHDGRLLLFDNRGGRDGASRVLEIDPDDGAIAWWYEGSDAEPFASNTCGAAQRLPNGNTLVTESDNGRAFEITPDGEIVWEFVNPHRAGPNGEYIATLMEVVRLPLDAWPGTGSRP